MLPVPALPSSPMVSPSSLPSPPPSAKTVARRLSTPTSSSSRSTRQHTTLSSGPRRSVGPTTSNRSQTGLGCLSGKNELFCYRIAHGLNWGVARFSVVVMIHERKIDRD